MLSLTQTRKLLEELGHSPRKALGQNYLIDANIVQKSLYLAQVQAGDAIVEVGPGLGTLTRPLLQAGASVYAVEADPTMYRYQAERLQPEFPDRLYVVQADAVRQPLAGLPPDIRATGSFKIVANLPYAISTPWLEQVLAGSLPSCITVMLQKEAADRFLAEPGTKAFGAVSIFLQAAYKRASAHPVARTCFHPAPKVDSMIAHFERLPQPRRFAPETRRAIRQIFTQRRKQIGGLIRRLDSDVPLAPWLESVAELGVTPQSRPEQVPLAAWLKLAVSQDKRETED